MHDTIELGIDQALESMNDAWNRGDAAAYASQFTREADYITFFGLHMRGRDAIEQSHRTLFEGPLKGSKMLGGQRTIRMLTADVALVVATGGTSLEGEREASSDRASVVTLTAVREGGRWRFASFQNTRHSDPARGDR